MTIHEGYETISKNVARELLATIDPLQRTLSQKNLDKIRASYAEHGFRKWLTLIVVSDTGTLIDGRHSMHLQAESDTPHEFFVVRGVPRTMISALGDGSTPWAPKDRLSMLLGERVTKNDMAIITWLSIVIDEEPQPRTDVARMDAFARWKPVLSKAKLVPAEGVGRIPLLRAGIQAPLGLAAIVDPDGAGRLLNELVGHSPQGVATNQIIAMLRDWEPGQPAGKKARAQAHKVLRCVEVGVGLATVRQRIVADEDCALRWKERYDSWLERRPVVRRREGCK